MPTARKSRPTTELDLYLQPIADAMTKNFLGNARAAQ